MFIWRRGLIVAVAGVSIGLVAVACGAQAPTPTPTRQPTATPRPPAGTPAAGNGDVAAGRALFSAKGCAACHGPNGQGVPGVGAKLAGMYGGMETLTDGSQVTVDDAYIRESISSPNAKVVKGFQPLMPPFTLSDAEMKQVTAFIASLK